MREHSITVREWNPVGRRSERQIDGAFVQAEKDLYSVVHFYVVGTRRNTSSRYILSCHTDFEAAWARKKELDTQINQALQNAM